MAKNIFFEFENVNKHQLREVIERVRRDKRRRREKAQWLAFSSRKKEFRSETQFLDHEFRENEYCEPRIMNQSEPDVSKRQKYVMMHERVDISQILKQKEDHHVVLTNDTRMIIRTLRKIRSDRQNIAVILDSIITQKDLNLMEGNIYREATKKFEESERNRLLANYRCKIFRLDYQLVMDIRKLSQNMAMEDHILGFLSKCHSTALKLLQVFVLGWHDLMKINRIREKFYGLLKSLVILSRVCKIICINYGDLNDFIIDVLNEKCEMILNAEDKECSEKIQEENCIGEEVKRNEFSNKKLRQSEFIDLKKADSTISIPLISFKKLAVKYFGGEELGSKGHIKSVRVSSSPQHDRSRRANKPLAKFSLGKKKKHSSDVIHSKTSANASIERKGFRKPDSSSLSQNSLHLETSDKDFNVESFSKQLHTTLEKEICANMKSIFNNFSFGQLQIYQTARKNNERLVFNHENHVEILGKLHNSLHLPQLEGIPLEIECGSLHQRNEVTETKIDNNNSKNEDSWSLKEEGDTVLQNHLSETRPILNLKSMETTPSSKNSITEPCKTSDQVKNSSDLTEIGKKETKLASETSRNSEPWDAIGRISEKLIEECLRSISSQLDFCILQNIFDEEFL